MAGPSDDDDEKSTRSLTGLAIVLLLVVAGLFLMQRLKIVSDLQDCLMSGRANCAPIDTSPATR